MPLRALYDLYARLSNEPAYEIPSVGRSIQQIEFVVVIDQEGTLIEIQDIRTRSGRGQPKPRSVEVLGIPKPSGKGFNPCFLWDAPDYLLGYPKNPENPERGPKAFEVFREAHLSVRASIGVAEFDAVCAFLSRWDPADAAQYEKIFGRLGFGVFQVRASPGYVHQHPDIQRWWDARTQGDPDRMKKWPDPPPLEAGTEGQCLITGSTDQPIARLHAKIKGVKGAHTSGATIAGFNSPAFKSYGLEQSRNAPVSKVAARRYTAALNALLSGPMRDKHRIVLGGKPATTVVFWTDAPTPVEDVFGIFTQLGSAESAPDSTAAPQDAELRQKLQAFLRALRKGKEAYGELAGEAHGTMFHILGLAAPTEARIAVRFYHRSTVADLLDRLRAHHEHIRIEREYGENTRQSEILPIRQILDQMCPWTSTDGNPKRKRPMREHIPPLLPAALIEAVLTGKRYPDGVYLTLLRRIASDRIVNYPRAAMLKGILVRNHNQEVSVSLDTTRADPAYRLGRLFAVLEHAQQRALGSELSATLRDRFYSTASCTPGAVFPRLLRTHQHHVSKIESRGAQIFYERLAGEILEPLEAFPPHLDLTEQGLFALGYYHQRNDLYRKKDSTEDTQTSTEAEGENR